MCVDAVGLLETGAPMNEEAEASVVTGETVTTKKAERQYQEAWGGGVLSMA